MFHMQKKEKEKEKGWVGGWVGGGDGAIVGERYSLKTLEAI